MTYNADHEALQSTLNLKFLCKSTNHQTSPAGSLWRKTKACLGIVLLILSIPVAILTPFPFVPVGLTVGITGAALLARNSRRGRGWLEKKINCYPELSKRTPDWLQQLVLSEKTLDIAADSHDHHDMDKSESGQ